MEYYGMLCSMTLTIHFWLVSQIQVLAVSSACWDSSFIATWNACIVLSIEYMMYTITNEQKKMNKSNEQKNESNE